MVRNPGMVMMPDLIAEEFILYVGDQFRVGRGDGTTSLAELVKCGDLRDGSAIVKIL